MSNDRWLVAHEKNYYPTITEFDNYEEAKEFFDKAVSDKNYDIGEVLYLASIEEIAEVTMSVG